MCGIFGAIGHFANASQLVSAGLKEIEYRGYDSWGIASFFSNQIEVQKEIGFVPEKLQSHYCSASIGHTRWATHGGVSVENAHPHLDCTKKIAVVHNGIIENFTQIKKQLRAHSFISETDTEVVSHLIEENVAKGEEFFAGCVAVFRQLSGLNAVVVMNGEEIVAFKKGSPIVVGKTPDGFLIASDPQALINSTKQLYFVKDGEILQLKKDSAKLFTLDGVQKELRFKRVKWEHSVAELGGYPHYLLKEISEQSSLLRKQSIFPKLSLKTLSLIQNAQRIYLVGCGTAFYACLVGKYLFSAYAGKIVEVAVGSEFGVIKKTLSHIDLLIAVSQSGETIDVVEPVQFAQSIGCPVLAITNAEGSTLYRMATKAILLEAGVEKAVLATKSFSGMVAVLLQVSLAVGRNKRGAEKILKDAADEVERIVKKQKSIKDLAVTLHTVKHLFILGRGILYPIALESALKIKESSYIHAEGFAAGELKHGVIALIEEGTPVIVYVPEDETKELMISAAMEVKARGGVVIGVAEKKHAVFDHYFSINARGVSGVFGYTVFAQLFAYFLTVQLGRNPDKPRNLAKSVVVR